MREAPGASATTRERVRRAAEEIGYRPDSRARLLRSSRSRLLGVVFGVQHAFHGDLVAGLYDAAEKAGYELALSAVTPERGEHRAVDSLLRDRCEALVLLGPSSPTAHLTDLATRLPVVVVARSVRSAAVDVVRTADDEGMHLAVDHLVDRKSTRLNSSHANISYAVFCLKKNLCLATVRASDSLRDISSPPGPVKLAPDSIADLFNRSAREMTISPVHDLVPRLRVVVTRA